MRTDQRLRIDFEEPRGFGMDVGCGADRGDALTLAEQQAACLVRMGALRFGEHARDRLPCHGKSHRAWP